jgi:inner membrane protein
MDTLTHGLLGAAAAAIPLPHRLIAPDKSPHAPRAAVLVGVIAAELPDIDYLLPASDVVLHTLRAHRGPTHAIIAAPLVAFVAVALGKVFFRQARFRPLYARALVAVLLAHLLPDLWTGWGTRLFLPFSHERVALDWTTVIDPVFTLPLVAAAGWALWRRASWRRALLLGVAVSGAYLCVRITIARHLTSVIGANYPQAESVHVFPAPLALMRWRYVAQLEGEYAAGSIELGNNPEEDARISPLPTGPVPASLVGVPTVREALAWARFPVVRIHAEATGHAHQIEISDLRYHLHGEPALTFVIAVAHDGTVTDARLDRNVSLGEFIRRGRQRAE